MIDFTYASISPSIIAGLRRYADEGIPTGHFLRAVLENDLYGAALRADDDSQAALCTIVAYVDNEMPRECWGSYAAVVKWLAFANERRLDAEAMKVLSDKD